ncbi:hypothetical protein HW115_19425 [Verrucomicrobiaceae bacterium N1E253]|uniref:Uncharacterized protein n=1 Tax=Oceaniferula marina TaxID=2748318 RepID=A0A851GKZ0_9BACT|nr:hypothetical protein [Oceaniferula marina]NWK57799.1 hypothetical protein [Oceaniferula marina]
MQGFAIFIAIVGLITTVLWLLIGWRAMTAHERVADAASLLAEQLRKMNEGTTLEEAQRVLYNEFLNEVKPDKSLSVEERSELFKSWKANSTFEK